MELIKRLWENFKVQPEIWFFSGFLLTFTLTIRKVLWFLPLRREFNEYSGVYLYLSDIFLGLTLMAWMVTILYNKIDTLSILKNVPHLPRVMKMFHVEHFFCYWGGTLILPLALVIWSFISLIWAENKIVSIFRSVKILEFYLLYVFILVRLFYWNINNNVLRGTLLKKIFRLIMIIGLFQAIIGIIQFLLQHSIELFWLKESLISPKIAGVAKVIFNGEVFIRAYGLFPHPNILGGFLLFSILISALYYKMFHLPAGRQAWNNLYGRRGTILFKLILGIQLLALILTFSKSAILGLFLGLVFLTYVSRLPRSKKMFHMKHFFYYWGGTFIDFLGKRKRLLMAASLIIIFSFFILKPDWNSLFLKSLNQRSVYANVSPARIAMQSITGGRGTMEDLEILFFGIGNSQFVISMENLAVIKENWMMQPVHNVFLLVWSELGIIGFGLLTWFMVYIFRTLWYGTITNLKNTFGAIFIGLLFIMFFDHYLWDIQQGSFLLWMTMGFLVGVGEHENTI